MSQTIEFENEAREELIQSIEDYLNCFFGGGNDLLEDNFEVCAEEINNLSFSKLQLIANFLDSTEIVNMNDEYYENNPLVDDPNFFDDDVYFFDSPMDWPF